MRNRFAASGSWLLLAQGVERAISLASIAILARLLTPSDFGVVALAGTVVAAVELLSAFGFDWALVRHPSPEREDLNSAWTLRVLLGALSAVSMLLLAWPAAAFYHLPQLRFVLPALAVGTLIGATENIGTVFFRREFAFHKEFVLRAAAKMGGFAVTIVMATIFRSYWALICGMIAGRFTNTIASYLIHSYRPSFSLRRSAQLIAFSSWLLVGNIVEYIRQRFSDLYLGRVFGPSITGLYSVTGELARMPISEVATPANRVAYSAYAERIRTGASLAPAYLQIAGFIWFISLPMAAGTIAVAPELIRLLLGNKWIDAVPVLRSLALSTAFTVMTANTHYVYWALGRTRLVALLSAIGACLMIVTTLICTPILGHLGVAAALVISSAILVPMNFSLLNRYTHISFFALWSKVWRAVISSLTMLLVLFVIFRDIDSTQTGQVIGLLLAKFFLGVLLYALLNFSMWFLVGKPEGPEMRLLAFFQPKTASAT